jgi:hypothetical protein
MFVLPFNMIEDNTPLFGIPNSDEGKGAASGRFVKETIQFLLPWSVIALHLHEKRLSVFDGDKIGDAFTPCRTDDIIPIPLQHPFHFPLSSSPQMVASHFISPPSFPPLSFLLTIVPVQHNACHISNAAKSPFFSL